MPKETTRVAALSDIPLGTMRYVDIDGLPIALANVGGTIYAFGDSCRHEGGPLSSGVLIDDTVTCPWHGAKFDIRTGEVLCDPAYDAVARYNVRVTGADIEVEI